ncbi:MAG: UPF0175 family protein [Methanosarcinaceae archaeon]
MTISVRYEPAKDIEFMTKLFGVNKSKMLRELIDEGRKMKSIVLYKQGKISLGLGAKIAKLSMSEYIDLLKEYKIPINIDIDDAKKSLQYTRTIL